MTDLRRTVDQGPEASSVAAMTGGSMLDFARSHLGWVLAACAFVAAAVLTKPSFDSIDAEVMGQVANNILHHGTPMVKLQLPAYQVREFHLGTYSKYGLGMSLVWVPFLALDDALGLSQLRLVTLVGPLLLAATVLVMFSLAITLGATRRQAAIVTMAIAFGTFLFTYGTTYFSESAVALTVAVALLGLSRLGSSITWAGAIGGASGLSVLFRTDSLVLVALPVACAMVALSPTRRQVAVATIVALPPLGLWGWYNVVRFGSLFSLGYRTDPGFTHPFGNGLVALLISPGKGIIWFAPVLILTLWSIAGAYRRWPTLTVLAIVLICSRFLFFASWWAWDGGLSFGPRFIVPALPAFAIPMTALVIDRGRNLWFVRIGAGLVVFGALMALLGAISFGSWGTNAPAGSWRSNPIVIVVQAHLHHQ